MRLPFLAALLGTTALLSPAAAQQTWQPGQQAQGQLDACPTLFQVVQQRGPQQTGVTWDQIQAWSQQRNEAACRQQLQRLGIASASTGQPPAQSNVQVQPGRPTQPTAQGQVQPQGQGQQQAQGDGGSLIVQGQPPQIVYDQPAPRVQVVQPQPQVTVRQPQPQIQVRMPAPTITVQQPQPEILVRMPQPDVNVAQAQPQVSVQMPPPQVRYAPPSQQPQVRVEPAQPQVVVQPTQPVQPVIQQAGAPSVQYQQVGEPRIVYQPAQGQPVIRYEQVDRQAGAVQQQATGQQQSTGQQQPAASQTQPAGTARGPAGGGSAVTGTGSGAAGVGASSSAASGPRQSISANELLSYDLYDASGQSLGDVERVLLGPDNRAFIVVGHGGFLGLGERRILVPLEQVRLTGDRLVAQGMTQAQAQQMPEWRGNQAGHRQLTGEQAVELARG